MTNDECGTVGDCLGGRPPHNHSRHLAFVVRHSAGGDSMAARTAEAIVVGAGVVGAAIAFQLTQHGLRDVLLIDKGKEGDGASHRSGALVRAHYSNAPEAALALAAQRWFHNWADLVGGDSGFTRTGFLQFVAPADNEKLRENVAMLQGIGVNTR